MSSAVAPAPEDDVENPQNKDGTITGSDHQSSSSSILLDNVPEHSWSEIVMGGLAVCAVGASVGAVVVVGGPLVIAAGACGSVIAPYAVYQQKKLVDVQALLDAHAAMKNEVDQYRGENERLEESVKELSATVSRLVDVEQALDVISQTAGQSVEEFAKQVEQNRTILKDMRRNLKSNVRQNLLSVLIRSDKDGDGTIDASEVEILIKRIQNVNGLSLNVDNFRSSIVKSGGSLKSIMDIVKSMLCDNMSAKQQNNIFQIEE